MWLCRGHEDLSGHEELPKSLSNDYTEFSELSFLSY